MRVGNRETQDIEQDLLNDIEASSKKIFSQSVYLQQEITGQNSRIDQCARDFESSKDVIERERLNLVTAREMDSSYCWMYTVIVIEALLLVCLLVSGI